MHLVGKINPGIWCVQIAQELIPLIILIISIKQSFAESKIIHWADLTM